MTGTDELDLARDAFLTHAWASAYERFRAADEASPLAVGDLEEYARAAYLIGEDESCVDLLGRAFEQRRRAGCADAAGDDAFWLAFNLLNRGEFARAGGWLGRAKEVTSGHGDDCPVRGKIAAVAALQQLRSGDAEAALRGFRSAQEIGQRSHDAELLAMTGLGIGQAKIALGEVAAGLAKLDEVMVAVLAGEVSPVFAGVVYCAVILACHNSYQPRRAAEWTRALSRWCDEQPELVLFRGDCLVHRAQILILNGAWQDALAEVDNACRLLSEPRPHPAVGAAMYERAELHRMRGEFAAAEEGYRRASEYGHEPQPGLALLRLGQGKSDAAWAGLQRVLAESATMSQRPRLLAAAVEIALARDDTSAARDADDELQAIAARHDSELLAAMAAHTAGWVRLAEGAQHDALTALRRAYRAWLDLDAPYQGARVRVLQAECCRRLGDEDAAQMEFSAAADIFRQLGARPDAAALEGLGVRVLEVSDRALTPREVQVLRTVATGMTNRAIAEELFLSEKTVARHLSNIFSKLDVSSRAAATAYAYEHELV